MQTLTINVGFLWFSQLREVLTKYAWESDQFKWEEGTGWLARTYYIKGPDQMVQRLAHRFEGWCSKPKEFQGNQP